MRSKIYSLVICGVLAATTSQANTIVYNFQEDGANINLGSSTNFTVSGLSLYVYASSGQSLYSKFTSGNASETGLGIASDSDHEINAGNFVQLYSSMSVNLTQLSLSSVQSGESALIYFSTSLGSLGTQIGTVGSDGNFNISAYQNGYIGVKAGSGNVLIASVTAQTPVTNKIVPTPRAPEAGSTMVLLGGVVTALGLIRRKLAD